MQKSHFLQSIFARLIEKDMTASCIIFPSIFAYELCNSTLAFCKCIPSHALFQIPVGISTLSSSCRKPLTWVSPCCASSLSASFCSRSISWSIFIWSRRPFSTFSSALFCPSIWSTISATALSQFSLFFWRKKETETPS